MPEEFKPRSNDIDSTWGMIDFMSDKLDVDDVLEILVNRAKPMQFRTISNVLVGDLRSESHISTTSYVLDEELPQVPTQRVVIATQSILPQLPPPHPAQDPAQQAPKINSFTELAT
ncbi:hypothetical protein PCANC_15553 [Puccinia coronata f. sp. avenae]|uniref:Uncharacterized protein n=1 Tax=Puccinia coronata f. sp. avenae TaxID=200324 RepID=A0A2N5SXA4_9BASI|nr:hypothetical protein PCANC_15553 [Puccinia coronata f. sp. avenae]